VILFFFFFSSRRRHTRFSRDWSSDVCSSDLPAASCPDPSGLTVNGLTENTANITWTAGGTETEWEIEYGITGFTPGTGTAISDNDGVLGETLTGLTANNAHEADVESIYSLVDERGLVDSESYTS